MAYLPLIGAPLTAFGYYFDSSIQMKLARYFFSEEFGHENRVKYLNFIKVPQGQPQGYYEKSVEYLVEHPLLARRLCFATNIALRALQTVGALMCAASATAAMGLTGTPAIVLSCVVITPIVTKLLAEQWPSLDCIDRFLNGMVVTATSIMAMIGLYPFEFIESTVLGYLSLGDAFTPMMLAFFKSGDVSKDAKAHWDKFLYYQQIDQDFKAGGGSDEHIEEILKTLKKDNAKGLRHYHWALLPKKKEELERKFLEMHKTRQKTAIGEGSKALITKIATSNFDNAQEIEEMAGKLREFMGGGFCKFQRHILREHDEAMAKINADNALNKEEKTKAYEAMTIKLNGELNELAQLIVLSGRHYMEKSVSYYARHHRALGQIDPAKDPKGFLKEYQTCLLLLDPFKTTKASRDFEKEQNNPLWLKSIHRKNRYMVHGIINRKDLKNMRTRDLNREFSVQLAEALKSRAP